MTTSQVFLQAARMPSGDFFRRDPDLHVNLANADIVSRGSDTAVTILVELGVDGEDFAEVAIAELQRAPGAAANLERAAAVLQRMARELREVERGDA